MRRHLLSLALLLAAAVSATAQTPIPRVGDSCPSGKYKSEDYCKQYSSETDKQAIPRQTGGECPGGWYKSGHYCVKYDG